MGSKFNQRETGAFSRRLGKQNRRLEFSSLQLLQQKEATALREEKVAKELRAKKLDARLTRAAKRAEKHHVTHEASRKDQKKEIFFKNREGEQGINLKPESIMTGDHFAAKLGKAILDEINQANGIKKERLIAQLKKLSERKESSSQPTFTFNDKILMNFRKLTSLIAEKAYLDLDLKEDGRRYTKLESEISALSGKLNKSGLPNDFFRFGTISVRTSDHTPTLDSSNTRLWVPNWIKAMGGSAMIAATAAGCAGQAPPAEVVPAAPTEEDAQEQTPATPEGIATQAPDLTHVTSVITEAAPTEVVVDEALAYPQDLSDWEIQGNSEDNKANIDANGAKSDREDIEESLRLKMGSETGWKFGYGYTGKRWTVFIVDKNELIRFATGIDENGVDTELPFAQLAPFGHNSFELHSNPMIEGGVRQELMSSKDGIVFGYRTVDENGNTLEFFNLENGRMVKVDLPDNLPSGWELVNNGQNIVGANGELLHEYFEGEWIKDFPRCEITGGDYENNLLTEENFDSGAIDKWLNSLTPELLETVDWDNIKDNVSYAKVGGYLIYNPEKAPNFDDSEKKPPQLRDTKTFGFIKIGDDTYLFMPVLLLDKEKEEGYWVKVVLPLQRNEYGNYKFTKEDIEEEILNWKKMSITPIGIDAISKFTTVEDELLAKTFAEYLNIPELMDQIIDGDPDVLNDHGNLDVLSKKGMLFGTNTQWGDYSWVQ